MPVTESVLSSMISTDLRRSKKEAANHRVQMQVLVLFSGVDWDGASILTFKVKG